VTGLVSSHCELVASTRVFQFLSAASQPGFFLTTSTSAIATFKDSRIVRLADIDGSGFAHFATYVRFMEETEYAFLRSRGLRVVLYDERGTMGFPRLNVQLDIHHPFGLDETVEVALRLVDIDGKQISYEFELTNETGAIAVEGRFQVAFCRFPDGKPPYAILIPEFVSAALQN
jgi:YbgC/YbaW family acyl-CoA thioester hydrolase